MKNDQHLLHSNLVCPYKFQSMALSDGPVRVGPIQSLNRLPQDRIGTVARALDQTIESGATRFRREIMLPRLIPVGPDEIADHSLTGRLRVVGRLAKALRGERTRGRAGHWTYSLNRHIGLLQAFKAERAALRRLRPSPGQIQCSAP